LLSAVYVIVILIFNSIENIIKENKIMVIDGSMSTPLENRGVFLNSKLWTAKILAEQPELIKQVHKNYFKAGADIILFETVPSLKEAKVEAEIAEEYGYDYWISFSCLSKNIICEGTPIAECATIFAKGYPHLKMIGVNCTKPEYITGLIHKIKENCDIPIGVYPNSGEEYDAVKKVWFGKQSALSFEQHAYNYMKSGVSAVGGCCTTVAKHVEEVVKAKKRFSEEQK
jgi:homocysteine S-methyltransferase